MLNHLRELAAHKKVLKKDQAAPSKMQVIKALTINDAFQLEREEAEAQAER